MYGYKWTSKNGVYELSVAAKLEKEIRPVFWEELDYFGFDKAGWKYSKKIKSPLLWAEGVRRYILNGEVIADAKGGGFYTKPEIVIRRSDITLKAVNIKSLWQTNEPIMSGLIQKAENTIRSVYAEYKAQGMDFVVAFSGGKDSFVLLDLVYRALAPDEFYVIFSNTDMELNCTLEAVELAKQRYSNLRFYEAKSHLSAEETWR